jgi:FecR-like protein
VSAVKSNRRRLAIAGAVATAAAVLVAVLVFTAGAATAKEFATLHFLQGTVDVARGEGPFGPGSDGQTLQAGDTVRTGADGRAEIEYFDGSLTRLDGATTFTLHELSSLPEVPNSKIVEAEQGEGRTFERITEITDSESRFDVDTPTATASVRGTTYALTVHPDGTAELWVVDGSVTMVLPDGSELVVGEGEGLIVRPDGRVEGPFALTEEQLTDPWVLFNQCTDDPALPQCQIQVESVVVEPPPPPEEEEGPQQGPPPSPDVQVLGEEVTAPTDQEGGGGGQGGDREQEEKEAPESDRRAVVITLTWTRGPANLDLHVATPATGEDEGGEVSASSPCLARSDGTCWAAASGDATAFGSETVTLHPLGSPGSGDWLDGGYRVWVENTSCLDGTYGTSDAVVTISRADGESISLPVSGAAGDPSLETWDVASVQLDRLGSMAVAGTQSLFGDPCGTAPTPSARIQPATSGATAR